MTILEAWGLVAMIIIGSAAGYAAGAALKQFYERDGQTPMWITTVSIVLATAGCLGGTWWGVHLAMTT